MKRISTYIVTLVLALAGSRAATTSTKSTMPPYLKRKCSITRT